MDDDLFFDNEDGGELPSQGVAPCSAFLAGPVLGEVALSGVDAQHESSLLRLLPPELLAALAGYLGPRASRHHPRCSPATFFQSCKMVHVLAKSTSTRVEFFVGTFGKAEIGDGMGDWLRLVTPEVLTAVFSRLRSCGEPIPRYQLQRLQRRLWIASRTDLLPIVMAHQAELYPGPPLQFRDRASFPYGTGASLTDSELFRLLVCWGRVPEGCEELVREGVKGGWADPNDSVITALRTLIRKYHLPIEHTSSGRSSLSQALFTVSLSNNVGRLQEPTFDPTFRIEPASDLRYDSYVPGTNAAHALLVQSAAAGNERAVRWLLQLGAPTVTSQITKGWFWNAMETWITLSEEETGGWNVAVENGTRAVEYVLGSRLVPQPPQQPCAVGRILNTLYRKHGVPSPYGHQHRAVGPLTPPRSSCEAVVTAAANGQLVTLRLILEHVQDRQGWDSQPGQKLLHQCLDLCQEQAACFNLIRSYCTTSANRSMELLASILANDQSKARDLIGTGTLLSTSQLAAVLKAPATRSFLPELLELLPLSPDTLDEVLKAVVPSWRFPARTGAGLNPEAELVASVEILVRHNAALWDDPRGLDMLSDMFDRNNNPAWRSLFRAHMGSIETLGTASRVAKFDMTQAVLRNDVEEVANLHAKGVQVEFSSELIDPGARPPANEPALVRLIELQPRASGKSSTLRACIRAQADLAARTFLRQKVTVDDSTVLECLRRFDDQGRAEMFKHLLRRAAKQAELIVGRAEIESRVRAVGGVFARRWEEYKASFRRRSSAAAPEPGPSNPQQADDESVDDGSDFEANFF